MGRWATLRSAAPYGPCRPKLGAMRIKVCGITRLEDAREAARLGAWAIGLNHWPGSPRRCDPSVAAQIGAELRRRLEVVGVFVNPSLDELARAAEDESLTMLQLHGDEGPAFCREAARRTGLKVIKALRVRSAAEVRAAEAYRTDYHLLDAHRPGLPGGTGESFDWELVGGRRSSVPLILAGGLRPGNVADAVAATSPFAVDVASGVEVEPGAKDHALMAEFVERARAAGADPRVMAR
jgi:phosphoribosylanthranilate isomerase